MFCKMCEENASMAGKTDFVSGNRSFKRETLVWHGNSKRHKDVRDSVIASKESGSTVTDNFERQRQQRDTKIMQDMHVKFVTAYTIAKEELPFTKFKPLLDMQRKNGLSEKISDSYNNDVKCAEMISCISEVMKEKLSSKLRDSMYFSVIIDAGTDASIKENEAMNVRYVEADGKPATKLLGLVELEHAHAEGTLQAINKAMNEAGFPEAIYQNHLVGFCADGASVNFGKVGGVQQKLRENIPWLIPIWCLPHRLELTVMNLLKKSTTAAAIMDILHLIYKTYHYSPKSRRELKSIGEELQVNVRNPARVKGTRWSPHIQKALKIMLKSVDVTSDIPAQYSVVFQHMKHLASTSNNADIKGAKHVSSKMKDFQFLAFCHFVMDILDFICSLSFTLQSNKTILLTAVNAIRTCID